MIISISIYKYILYNYFCKHYKKTIFSSSILLIPPRIFFEHIYDLIGHFLLRTKFPIIEGLYASLEYVKSFFKIVTDGDEIDPNFLIIDALE